MSASGHNWRQDNPPVCPEPKVFVGQLPFESTTQDVQNLFSQYGAIRSCQVIAGPDGRSKGCAMILYSTWTEAEAAVDAENGTTHLGGSKPMVVKFADPPRRGDGPIVGIAPRKLFVGQIPASMGEEQLRAMFTPYGTVVEVHLLKKNLGSGCGFVTYDRWAACEAAINALHGKTHLDGAKMPMVVKFADAKVPIAHDNGFGQKRAYDTSNILGAAAVAGAMAGAAVKKSYMNMGAPGAFPYAMPGYGMGMGQMPGVPPGMGGYGMGMVNMGGMGMAAGMPMGMAQGMQPGMQPGLRPGLGMPPKMPGIGNQAMQASKMGTGLVDDQSKSWKLFVGQVPFEANEADLWSVFSTVGNILELVILRTPQGKSKGCAFVTYESRELADKAIRQFDGQVALPEDPKQRLLIVKYAGGGGGSPAGVSNAAMGGNNSAGDLQQSAGGARNQYGTQQPGFEMAGAPQGPPVQGMVGAPPDMYAAAQMQAQQGMYHAPPAGAAPGGPGPMAGVAMQPMQHPIGQYAPSGF